MGFTIRSARFITSVGPGSPLPARSAAEIAVVGKSNVGKSSLINSLCGRNKLAKTSATPGKTRLINFFLLNEEIADLRAISVRDDEFVTGFDEFDEFAAGFVHVCELFFSCAFVICGFDCVAAERHHNCF